ncbi:hypothetical protein KQ51_01809 [Candidatus Izimaplasma bacterium HR1]|uniref:hypothetical protein n=1 Tax=Candidatus Izimoplasma sp. HR1 TaxID=1541959 RepID=UPI0004F6D038|nr:hypothetical protein KQ51_01809 [Candidatus Izimaplasma bacterium HR1]
MNKQTKYYFILKYTILALVINIVLGFLKRTFISLNLIVDNIMNPIYDIIGIVNVLLVIAIILGTLYLIYLIAMYYASSFYNDYHINPFEAIYHGFIDIHHLYARVKSSVKVKNMQVDFKRSTIYFSTRDNHYCLKYIDLFGKIRGKETSEFWASLSRPRTQYSQKTYTRVVKFPNPYRANQNYIEDLKSRTTNDYKNFVVISGFYNMKEKAESIIAPYEILDFLMKEGV